MKVLADGSVIPSTLSSIPLPDASESYMNEQSMMQGTVIAMYYPEEDGNLSKEFVEYDVLVSKKSMKSGSNLLVYKNCQVSDLWGTVNNYHDFTLQPAEKVEDGVPTGGAQVLLLCTDAMSVSGKAMIVGAKKTLMNKPSKDRGQFDERQFNGLNILINKDGEYVIEFKTPQTQEGKPVSDDAAKSAGTILKIDKDGKFSVTDNEKQTLLIDRVAQTMTWGNENDSIVIDKKNKVISAKSSKDLSTESKESTSVKSGKDMTLDSGGKISEKATGDVSQEAGGNFQQKSGGNWTFDVSGNVSISAGGNVDIEAGGVATLNGLINNIGAADAPCAAVGVSMCVGVGNLGFTVISQIITGSSTVSVGT